MVQKHDSNTQEEINTAFNHCAILLAQHPSFLPHLFIEYTPQQAKLSPTVNHITLKIAATN